MKLTQAFAAAALAVTAVAQVVAQAGDAPAASAAVIDAELPAGNVVVEKIEGDTVYLHQDLRDSSQDWFYWKFRVRGAAGRTLRFREAKTNDHGDASKLRHCRRPQVRGCGEGRLPPEEQVALH